MPSLSYAERLPALIYYFDDVDQIERQAFVRLGIDICHALEICHQNGILHLDVKPDNIFVNDRLPSEVVFKLGDFGVSRDYLKAHSDSVMQGTLLYMAPEVSRNEAAGCQADLYSLGLTLYRLMNCNRLPFLEEKQFPSHEDLKDATRMRLSGITLPEPKEASSAFSDVIRKACAYRPEDRYRNAIEMKKALTGLLRKKSDSSYTSGSWRRKSTLFLIIIFAVLAAFCAWGFWQGKENSKTKMADPSVPEATSIPMIVVIDRGGKAP